jgi:hypothetical protein
MVAVPAGDWRMDPQLFNFLFMGLTQEQAEDIASVTVETAPDDDAGAEATKKAPF